MTEEEKEKIKEEINFLQNKLNTLLNNLETEKTPASEAEQQQDQDVVQDENIPVVHIDTTTKQEEE